MLVGLGVFRSPSFRRSHFRLNRRLGRRISGAISELTTQLSHDGLGELGLDGEHVLQITSKIFRPELLARVGTSEPGRDAHDVTSLAHASLDQMRHAEFLPDLLCRRILAFEGKRRGPRGDVQPGNFLQHRDRKSTRLNSSHRTISYAVFCLKKKKKNTHKTITKQKQKIQKKKKK